MIWKTTRAGITWLLSDEVMAMGPSAWAARYAQLADIRSRPPKRAYVAQTHPDSGLRDWLTHQKALKRLGALPCDPQPQQVSHGVHIARELCVSHQVFWLTLALYASPWPGSSVGTTSVSILGSQGRRQGHSMNRRSVCGCRAAGATPGGAAGSAGRRLVHRACTAGGALGRLLRGAAGLPTDARPLHGADGHCFGGPASRVSFTCCMSPFPVLRWASHLRQV